KNSTSPWLSLPASFGMNKTLNEDKFNPPRRIDAAKCHCSLKDGSTIKKEEGKRNRKERLDGLSRRLPSTLCPCSTAQATVRPGMRQHCQPRRPLLCRADLWYCAASSPDRADINVGKNRVVVFRLLRPRIFMCCHDAEYRKVPGTHF